MGRRRGRSAARRPLSLSARPHNWWQAGAIDRKLARVARDHSLTGAETRVAARLLLGENTIQVARKLGVAPTTVRTHLQRILAKTDTHRQSEFACLVARYGN